MKIGIFLLLLADLTDLVMILGGLKWIGLEENGAHLGERKFHYR